MRLALPSVAQAIVTASPALRWSAIVPAAAADSSSGCGAITKTRPRGVDTLARTAGTRAANAHHACSRASAILSAFDFTGRKKNTKGPLHAVGFEGWVVL